MKKGFTLIELLAVIVILAIIALIATPVILNIIDDARDSSNKESINLYAKAIENAVANYLLKNPEDTNITLEKIEEYIKYDGNKVECDTININSNGSIYLKDCKVNDIDVEYTYGIKEEPSCYISKDEDNDNYADIGDMITCGTESFYVISNDGKNIEMLAEKNITLTLPKETT